MANMGDCCPQQEAGKLPRASFLSAKSKRQEKKSKRHYKMILHFKVWQNLNKNSLLGKHQPEKRHSLVFWHQMTYNEQSSFSPKWLTKNQVL